jgi:branched-chain amino acid transport system ATP-binding protein
MIEVDTVAKRFGWTEALAGVSLAVERGKVLALLGPNGAEKTTLRRGRLSAANRSNATRFRSPPAPSALPSHTPLPNSARSGIRARA